MRSLCNQLDVPCTVEPLQIKQEIAKRKKASIQSIARDFRYRVLTQLAQQQGFTKVALGHTMDDQAETVLLGMLRGAGLNGLSGMPVFRAPCIIRPFLEVLRSEVESYLREHHWAYRMDSSNQSAKYRRNRLRHDVMPVLKQLNPKIIQGLSRQSRILFDESTYLDQVAANVLDSVTLKSDVERRVLNQKKLAAFPPAIQRRVVLLCYRIVSQSEYYPRADFVDGVLRLIRTAVSGLKRQFHGIQVYRDYQEIHFCKINEQGSFIPNLGKQILSLSLPGSIGWPLTNQTLEAVWVPNLTESWKDDLQCVYLDGDQVTNELVVRQWKPGDVFYPLGMNGRRKKIQDFFSDMKVKRVNRAKVPLVVAPEGIVWLGGLRLDHRFRITENTKKIISLRLRPEFPSLS